MGTFATVIHVYNRSQADTVTELINELREARGLSRFERLEIAFGGQLAAEEVLYLITEQHGPWLTIVEINVNLTDPFYLYELTTSLSNRLKTYCLSFHLHDGDVLYYNLEKEGASLDGYSSDYQYFFEEPVDKEEILSQRHAPQVFADILPATKEVNRFNSILNEGYWDAFDNNDLDADGIPNNEKYDVDEKDRLERIGKYLEIYSKDSYPFAGWYDNLPGLDLSACYLLKAAR